MEQVSFGVPPGAVKAVIGPNGAGKTTLFNLVTRLSCPPGRAASSFRGKKSRDARPTVIARQGIARTFQLVQLFDHMTVLENVMVGRHRLSRAGLLAGALQFPWTRAEEKAIRQKALEALEFVGLADRAQQPAAVAAPGTQTDAGNRPGPGLRPTLLLLDEPASGLDAVETERLQEMILALKDRASPPSWWSTTWASPWRWPMISRCSTTANSSPTARPRGSRRTRRSLPRIWDRLAGVRERCFLFSVSVFGKNLGGTDDL